MHTPARLLPLVLLVLTACPPQGPADLCNTQEEALRSRECQLTPGVPLKDRYLSFEHDTDYYSVRMPSDLGPRSVLRVTASYGVSSTPVSLSVRLLHEDGGELAPRRVDAHGEGEPHPVEFLLPFSEPGARLLLQLSDTPANPSQPGYDVRNPYSLRVEVLENPDAHEPNDTADMATSVPLTNQEGAAVGSASGFLATDGDVDRFAFDVPAGKIVYARVTAPGLAPPSASLLSYQLLRPDGTVEDEAHVDSPTVAADLATARRAPVAGRWQVLVRAWNGGTSSGPPPGDLRLQYTVDVKVLDEADVQESPTDNDELARARPVSFEGKAPPASASFTGRLGSVQDKDWYAVRLPSSTVHTVLHYRLVPLSTGGRFPPLPGAPHRLVRVLSEVQGSSAHDCVTKADVCPKGNGYGTDPEVTSRVDGWCGQGTPLCLHSSRDESEAFPHLRNLEGVLPVPPHGASVSYFFLVQDEGSHWADDRDYRLEVEWLDDPDETSRKKGGVTETPEPKMLASDDAGTAFPAPPRGAEYEVRGSLSHGLGGLVGHEPSKGQGVRGPRDYDAVPTDVDSFSFILPPLPTPLDRTWELQWEVADLPDGGVPHGLSLALSFCDGDRLDASGVCTPVSTGSAGAPLTLAYSGAPMRAWYSPAGGAGELQPLYSLERGDGVTRVTVRPQACACLEPRFLRGGSIHVFVSAVDRMDYGQANYTLRTAYTGYPRTYSTPDGGTASCPLPEGEVPGCVFTRQP
ncbi:MAG TPA: cell-cell cohesion protein MtsF [Archangium sp.]|uniref:cell-cell cohesion protein MtsF n=1 Tax=Archangium sp. TaxID=1872627 RepID=UPI002E32C5E1|nr:cell-cell cohesion protein MtsF [Archangium sp.]HEX5754000.1 cell-cell cohesion protein MtsF [Archangium sp.]